MPGPLVDHALTGVTWADNGHVVYVDSDADGARFMRLEVATGGTAQEHRGVQRDPGEPHAHAVEDGDDTLDLAGDARLLEHLLDRDLAG